MPDRIVTLDAMHCQKDIRSGCRSSGVGAAPRAGPSNGRVGCSLHGRFPCPRTTYRSRVDRHPTVVALSSKLGQSCVRFGDVRLRAVQPLYIVSRLDIANAQLVREGWYGSHVRGFSASRRRAATVISRLPQVRSGWWSPLVTASALCARRPTLSARESRPAASPGVRASRERGGP
jgi:hypothetical protein